MPTSKLPCGDVLVGTGGSIPNLAKTRPHATRLSIPRLHGYILDERDVTYLAHRLAGQTAAQRAQMPGLNASRFDSIVGGGLCLRVVMDTVDAVRMVVSGHGLREGVAVNQMWDALPAPGDVRRGGSTRSRPASRRWIGGWRSGVPRPPADCAKCSIRSSTPN
jgi:exopolyphosphatase/pppGpp-phosphohydrolase